MKRSWAGHLTFPFAGGELYTEFQVVLALWTVSRGTSFVRV